jgi:Transposase DDE domain
MQKNSHAVICGMVAMIKNLASTEDPMAVSLDATTYSNHLSTDAWHTEVCAHLPPDLDQHAARLGAFQRVRGLTTPTDLLRMLLLFALDGTSFRMLGVWAVLMQVGSLSDTAWRKRLQRASPLLLWLIGQLLAISVTAATTLRQSQRRILLIDTTRLRQSGGTGDDWRLHCGYDLLASRLTHIHVTDRHTAEGFGWLDIQAGDLLVADSGYGTRAQVVLAVQRGADVVIRTYLPNLRVLDDRGHVFDATTWLMAQHGDTATWSGWCRHGRKQVAIRLIAMRLPADKCAAAMKRRRRKAQKNGRTVSARALALAQWMVLVTTLDATTWPAADVLALYQARWHIELLFKRLKQLVPIASLRGRSRATAEATVRATLVAWLLNEAYQAELHEALAAGLEADSAPISHWRVALLGIELLRQQVRGTWTTATLLACLPQLTRYLSTGPRKRRYHATTIVDWLRRQLLEPSQLLRLAAA